MKVFTLAAELPSIHIKNPNRKIAFIPTMGALHEGHLSLVEAAQQDGYVTVVSIFINPLQFNNSSDLEKYPRTLALDLALLEAQGVDFVFTPTNEEMYPSTTADVVVDLGPLDSRFEGACRPGHFHGVVQVVYRLFNYVQPHVVYFGEKDLQQCLVIEQLVAQHFPDLQMCRVVTKREASGLAMSSRNMRLSDKGLETAAAIYKSLTAVVANPTQMGVTLAIEKQNLTSMGFDVEYLSCVMLPFMDELDNQQLQSLTQVTKSRQYAVVFAGSLEGVRLIDNLVF
ncbi:MAG: hypothetical protein RLZZ510_1747 [Bacteroidota bacterium]